MFENIMIATDGSKHSDKAAGLGLEIARLSGGKVSIVYVADTSKMSHLPDDMLLLSIREILIKEGKEATARVETMAKKAGLAVEKSVIEGNPGEEIIRFAEENGASLIVMGSVGKTGLDRFLLGSVAEKVVRNSKVPVMTVPGGGT